MGRREPARPRGAIGPGLIFLWLLSLHQGKESNNKALRAAQKNKAKNRINVEAKANAAGRRKRLLPLQLNNTLKNLLILLRSQFEISSITLILLFSLNKLILIRKNIRRSQ